MGRLAYALATLPLLMQLVQTRIRLAAPLTRAWTAWRFGFQRRRVTLWAWEMLLPNCGPLPQTSHTCAIAKLQNPSRVSLDSNPCWDGRRALTLLPWRR